MNSREYYDACHQVPSHGSALFSRRRRNFLLVLISFAAEQQEILYQLLCLCREYYGN